MMEKELVIRVADLVTIITEAQKGRDYTFMCDRDNNGRYITSVAFFDPKTHFKTQEVNISELTQNLTQDVSQEIIIAEDGEEPDLDGMDVSDFVGKEKVGKEDIERILESMGDNEDF